MSNLPDGFNYVGEYKKYARLIPPEDPDIEKWRALFNVIPDDDVDEFEQAIKAMGETDFEIEVMGYQTLLAYASQFSYQICQYLLDDLGLDPNTRAGSEKDQTALFSARGQAIGALIDKGASQYIYNAEGECPFTAAIGRGDYEQGLEFLKHNLDLGARNCRNDTPLFLATALPADVGQELPEESFWEEFFYMCEETPKVARALNLKCQRGNTCLHAASEKKREDIMRKMLEFGADPDAHNEDGINPYVPAEMLENVVVKLKKGGPAEGEAEGEAETAQPAREDISPEKQAQDSIERIVNDVNVEDVEVLKAMAEMEAAQKAAAEAEAASAEAGAEGAGAEGGEKTPAPAAEGGAAGAEAGVEGEKPAEGAEGEAGEAKEEAKEGAGEEGGEAKAEEAGEEGEKGVAEGEGGEAQEEGAETGGASGSPAREGTSGAIRFDSEAGAGGEKEKDGSPSRSPSMRKGESSRGLTEDLSDMGSDMDGRDQEGEYGYGEEEEGELEDDLPGVDPRRAAAEAFLLEEAKLEEEYRIMLQLAQDEKEKHTALEADNLLLQKRAALWQFKHGNSQTTSGAGAGHAAEQTTSQPDSRVNEFRYLNVLRHVHEVRKDLRTADMRGARMCEELKDKLDDKRLKAQEGRNALREFKRIVARRAVFSRTGKPIPSKTLLILEDLEQAKEAEVEVHRGSNIALKNRLTRLETQLRKRDELAHNLCVIDFEQLKIENQTLNEKIEERNEELHKLRKKTVAMVQVITHMREKLQALHQENQVQAAELQLLDNELTSQRTLVSKTKAERDKFRTENLQQKQKTGIINSELLTVDYSDRIKAIQQLHERISQKKDEHMRLTRFIVKTSKELRAVIQEEDQFLQGTFVPN